MSNIITATEKNSDTVLPKGKREILSYTSPLLVPCAVSEEEDGFIIEYNIEELFPYDDIKVLPEVEKYRFLYNCGSLFSLISDFSFSLSPENVYSDMNLLPRIMKRDIGRTDLETFVEEYKALIATTLVPKYAYEDYLQGGADLFEKEKNLKELLNNNDFEELRARLREKHQIILQRTRKNKTQVSRRVLLACKIALPTLAIITSVSIGIAVYLNSFELPLKEALLSGHAAYLKNDFAAVQSDLVNVNLEEMSFEIKYILSRSYVMSESLNTEQKENVLATLMMQADELYFEYWIYLGREQFEESIDTAQRIGDNQLLLLSYIKYEAFLQTDTQTLSGSEKAEKLEELNNLIEGLNKKLNPEEER